MGEKIVFISYSHDSEEHRDRVLGLGESLSRDGCDCRIDAHKDTDEDWPLWMTRQLTEANFIVCVVSETYARRFQDQELPDRGHGVGWEAGLIRRLLYKKKLHNDRIFPVFFDKSGNQHIPLELVGYDFFLLDSLPCYETLLRKVLNRPLHAKPNIGIPPDLKSSTSEPLFARPGSPPAPSPTIPIDLSHFDVNKYAPTELLGRDDELALLDDAWNKAVQGVAGRPHVLTFVALGGEGKTSLVSKWAANLAHREWSGCTAVFAWSFYSQGTRDQSVASPDLFLKEALIFFGDREMAESAAGAFDKGKRLASLVSAQRALLIIDGLEPLQYPPTSPTSGELKDQGMRALLKGLAAANQGLCLVTTRYAIADLRAYHRTTAPQEELRRLPKESGIRLLKKLGVHGAKREFETLVEDVKGHALTLNLLGSYLHDAHGGDIRKRDVIKLEEANAEEQNGHAFHVMDAYVAWFETGGTSTEDKLKGQRALAILRLLGLFDRPASTDCLEVLWKAPAIAGLTATLMGLSVAQRNTALTRLETAKLLTVNRDAAGNLISQDAHPLLREYFAKQLRETNPAAWRAGHQRLYEHLCATTPDKPEPTLEDLQPLYQAVAHGCQAGLQQEARDKVYWGRILRGKEAYSTRKLGAFGSDLGAAACYFETTWSRVSPAHTEAYQAWLLNEAAFCLRALGRLVEALEPMRAGLKMVIKEENWGRAADSASNLSELELTLGEVAAAIADAGHSVTYADRSDNAFQRMSKRTSYADALHQAGRRDEAEALFRVAEQMQVERQPDYPLLYSLSGFRYCDLLLIETEREAGKSNGGIENGVLLAVCHAIEQRAAKTLKWAEQYNMDILSIALDHLTMGRTALYLAILEQADLRLLTTELSHIDHAVTGLRRSGNMDDLPRGLLTRAWLRSLTGPLTGQDSAQGDLDEAWEIAERGPMPLHMVDIHLYRARLYGRMKDEVEMMKYPWESPQHDLAEARRLIVKHGYLRRMGELEDVEAAL